MKERYYPMAKKYDYEKLEQEGKTDVHVDGEIIKNLESKKEITEKTRAHTKHGATSDTNPFHDCLIWK